MKISLCKVVSRALTNSASFKKKHSQEPSTKNSYGKASLFFVHYNPPPCCSFMRMCDCFGWLMGHAYAGSPLSTKFSQPLNQIKSVSFSMHDAYAVRRRQCAQLLEVLAKYTGACQHEKCPSCKTPSEGRQSPEIIPDVDKRMGAKQKMKKETTD